MGGATAAASTGGSEHLSSASASDLGELPTAQCELADVSEAVREAARKRKRESAEEGTRNAGAAPGGGETEARAASRAGRRPGTSRRVPRDYAEYSSTSVPYFRLRYESPHCWMLHGLE